MLYEVKHQNSAGHAERQAVHPSALLPLLNKIERMGGSGVEVIGPSGKRWTEAQTRRNFASVDFS